MFHFIDISVAISARIAQNNFLYESLDRFYFIYFAFRGFMYSYSRLINVPPSGTFVVNYRAIS